MKKNTLGLILLALLLALAYWIYTQQSKGIQEAQDFKDYAIEDTAAIDRIFMSKLNGEKVLLSRREDGIWRVNNDFKAREDAIKLLLKTAHDVEIQSPVGDSFYPTVISRLASHATKVEFYTGGKKPEKIWYVGHPTGSLVGTYMLLEKDGEKSDKPYILHMPMEKGSLGSRFFTDAQLWRDRAIFTINPQEIKSIKVEHKYDTATSFQLVHLGQGQFELINLKTQEKQNLAESVAIPYFKKFKAIYYEYLDTRSPKEITDSIYGSIPRHKITIEDASGRSSLITTFNMPVREGAELNGKAIFYNPERMYAFSSVLGDKDRLVVQNYTFDALTPGWEDFLSSTTVEK